MRRVLAALAAVGACAGAAPARASSPAGPEVVCRLADARLDEASGLAVGIRSPGVLYLQNDSGDSARVFAVDAHTCRTRAVIRVPDAVNVDWEDIAVARDGSGAPSLWIGDIGDNTRSRSEIRIYRVSEPHVGATAAVESARPSVWRLRYPSGPADAESLAVAPGGAAYVVTKSVTGVSTVWAVPARPDAHRVQALRRIATVDFPLDLADPTAQLATGAAISPDGRLLVIRTYTDAYFWRIGNGDLAAALRAKPVRVTLPGQPQGEGVTFAGRRILLDSETAHSALYSVPVPAALFAPVPAASSAGSSTVSTPAPSPSAPAASSVPSSASSVPSASSASPAAAPAATSHAGLWWGVAGAVVLGALGATGVLWRRRRGRHPV